MDREPGFDWGGGTISELVRLQHRGGMKGRMARRLLRLYGLDVDPSVRLPSDSSLRHGGIGIVINGRTTIGHRVLIYPGVKIVRGQVWESEGEGFGGFVIENEAILGAGCILVADGPRPLVVGAGSVVGAGAVLTKSTGEGERWAGNPARLLPPRDPSSS